MNIVKFVAKAFLAGIVFSVGAYFAVAVLFPAVGIIDNASYLEEYIQDTEGRIGKSCLNVREQALEFTENDISEIIEHGLEGGDWIIVMTAEQKEFIDFNDEWLMECDLARNFANELGENWPEFTDLHRLFSTLSTLSTSYSSRPATAERLNPQAFEDVQYYYRNITNISL